VRVFQDIVVGSGPGGAITSHFLKKAGRDVLLIEAGSRLFQQDTVAFSKDEMLRKYWNGGVTVTLGTPRIPFILGKCFGGGSEINAGIYHRASPQVLEEWARRFQLRDIDAASLNEHYEYFEKELTVSSMPDSLIPKASKVLAEGARKLNWKCFEVPRWFDYDKAENQKQTMSETFLSRNIELDLEMVFEKTVRKLKQENGIWRVLTFEGDSYHAENIFVCAGAVQTPSILMRSGIGRNVGKSLQLHPTIKATALFDDEINTEGMGVPVHQVREFSPAISLGCSISSLPYLSLALSEFKNYPTFARENWKRMSTYYAMIRPESCARIINIPFTRDPVIRYDLSDRDIANLLFGLKKLCQLLFAAGARKVFPSLLDEKFILDSEDQIESKLTRVDRKLIQLMSIHLFGSCPMGENPALCATDSYGRINDREGLYVNDASLLCTSLGLNPQGTLMCFARRNVLHFLETRGG